MQQTAHRVSPKSSAPFAHPHRNTSAFSVDEGMEVADFGSGSGAYALALAERVGNSGHVYAIDVQKDLLRRIQSEANKKGYKHISVLWGDLERSGGSKIASAQVDLVLISNLLFQVEYKESVLAEAKRILKPGGTVVIIDWSESFGGMGPQKSDVVDKKKVIESARGVGLELAREFPAGAHHYGLIFKHA